MREAVIGTSEDDLPTTLPVGAELAGPAPSVGIEAVAIACSRRGMVNGDALVEQFEHPDDGGVVGRGVADPDGDASPGVGFTMSTAAVESGSVPRPRRGITVMPMPSATNLMAVG